MAFQLEITASRRNGVLLTSSEHISTKEFFILFYVKGLPTVFQINHIVHLAVILAWLPKETRHQWLYCLSASVLFPPFLSSNCTLHISMFQSETGYGKARPSVSSFSCSKIICCESYKKWVNYNTKQTNIRKKMGMFSFVSGLSWYLYTSAFQIVKTYKKDCSSFNNRASNTWLPQNQLLQCN